MDDPVRRFLLTPETFRPTSTTEWIRERLWRFASSTFREQLRSHLLGVLERARWAIVVCRSIVSDVVCPLDRVLQVLVAEPPPALFDAMAATLAGVLPGVRS